MVTRALEFTMVDSMMVDVTTATVSTVTLQFPGKYGNTPELLDIVRSTNETENFKIAAITAARPESRLYGMTEAEFMTYGHVLPPRTKAEQGEQGEAEQAAE